MKIWEQFCLSRGENRSMAEIPTKELDCLLGVFFQGNCQKNGEPYEPDSLTSFHRSFNRHLSQNGAQFNIITDKEFIMSRATLAARRKQLRSMGKGQKPNASSSLSDGDEEQLFGTNQLSDSDPKTLIRTVWYFLTLRL